MSEPMSCCRALGGYCERCDLLVGLDGVHVTAVERDDGGRLVVAVESEPMVMGCPACGVVAHGHGRVAVTLVDAPAMGRPVRIIWRKRRWVCPDVGCPVKTFVEQDERTPPLGRGHRACRPFPPWASRAALGSWSVGSAIADTRSSAECRTTWLLGAGSPPLAASTRTPA